MTTHTLTHRPPQAKLKQTLGVNVTLTNQDSRKRGVGEKKGGHKAGKLEDICRQSILHNPEAPERLHNITCVKTHLFTCRPAE